jgi:hypothetical protein
LGTETISDIGRFAIVPLWLIESSITSTAVRLFGIMAAKYADRDSGTLFPSRKRLADDLGAKSPRTVDAAIDALVKIGALSVMYRTDERGAPTSNLYTLHFIAPPHATNCTPLAENRQTPLAENDETPSRRKLRTEPESTIEPESIEPELLLSKAEPLDFQFPDWFQTLSRDPRWHGKDSERYIKTIEKNYQQINLDLEAHAAYEWLQSPKGQKKKVLRGFWINWLRQSTSANRNGTSPGPPPPVTDTVESPFAKYGRAAT